MSLKRQPIALDEIKISPYQKVLSSLLLKFLFIDRAMPQEMVEELPSIGFIATNGNTIVGAAFLRTMEGDYGMFEGLITNPNCSSELRQQALAKLIPSILKKAEELKLNKILAFTHDKSVIFRAEECGFKTHPDNLIVLDLGR